MFLTLRSSRGLEGSEGGVTGAASKDCPDLWDRKEQKVAEVVRKSKRADVLTTNQESLFGVRAIGRWVFHFFHAGRCAAKPRASCY